jgi:hypothetical protein
MIEKPAEAYLAAVSRAGKPQPAAVAIAGRLNATAKKPCGWIILIGLMREFRFSETDVAQAPAHPSSLVVELKIASGKQVVRESKPAASQIRRIRLVIC